MFIHLRESCNYCNYSRFGISIAVKAICIINKSANCRTKVSYYIAWPDLAANRQFLIVCKSMADPYDIC